VKIPGSRGADRASHIGEQPHFRELYAALAEVDRALGVAQRRVALLANLAPRNFASEVQRIRAAFERGRRARPGFVYGEPPNLEGLASDLSTVADRAQALGPLGVLYAERARELALEAEIVAARGTCLVGALASRRYDPGPHAADADVLANVLAISRDEHDGAPFDVVTDDADDPRSLLCRMRDEIGRRKLAVRVIVARGLAPLAAVGDSVVQIAAARRVRVRDVERTVLHEIAGHLEPASRAATLGLGLLRVGTRRGSDDQEGYALFTERGAGHLAGARARELAARHIAARAAHAGVGFEDTVTVLLDRGVATGVAVQSACRAYRGGGLGREAAYLPALLRVERAVSRDPAIASVLASGRVSVAAAPILGVWLSARDEA